MGEVAIEFSFGRIENAGCSLSKVLLEMIEDEDESKAEDERSLLNAKELLSGDMGSGGGKNPAIVLYVL